ncbi:MAG: tail fiber protein [bacterium]|nr:tail fiber protein [bacterium]
MKIEININDRLIKFIQYIFSGKRLVLTFAASIIATSAIVYSSASIPHTFTKGETISSSQMNANFQALKNKIDELETLVEGVPTGTIVPFAGPTDKIPDGWLLCDGTSLERDSQYNDLFQIIDTAWGAMDGIHFNLPDLRGLFIRGVDHGAGKDPDVSSRIGIKSGSYLPGSNADNVGSYQDDELKNHNHYLPDIRFLYSRKSGEGSGLILGKPNYETSYTGGDESRPKNAYVNYIIKYL